MAEAEEMTGDGADDDDEVLIEAIDGDPHAADRQMVETLLVLVQNRYDEPFEHRGVQIAYERMMLAAMERVTRICQNDLPADEA